jgi:ketosteroid isomerase-like protein
VAGESIGDLIRRGTEAFNDHDVEGVLALITDDVEWKRVDGLPDEGGTIHGKEAVREFLRPEVFETAHLEPLEIVEDEDTALMWGRFTARGAASGIELSVETYIVYRVRDGLTWRVENWRGREDAERSSGLRLSSHD